MPGQPGHNKRPHARLPPSFLGLDAWMTSQLNVALIRKLRVSLMCLAYFFYLLSIWVFVQPLTGRRPIDWCRNLMSVLYYHYRVSIIFIHTPDDFPVILYFMTSLFREFFNSDTVQTSNSCTSRPDVDQCLVAQTPMYNMSKNKPSTSITHVACELGSVVRKFGGNRTCGHLLCPACPRI